MLFAVVPTYELGRRRTRDQMASAVPVQGHLKLYDWPLGNAYNRSTRVAELHDPSPGAHPTLLPSLFDAAVARITFKGMLLVGTEIISIDGVLREYKQGRRAKPIMNRAPVH